MALLLADPRVNPAEKTIVSGVLIVISCALEMSAMRLRDDWGLAGVSAAMRGAPLEEFQTDTWVPQWDHFEGVEGRYFTIPITFCVL